MACTNGLTVSGPVRADQQRIAVGRRARHELGADAAAGAGAVVDHHRLSERLADLIADDAADNVGIAAGRERHDQPDRPVGKSGEGIAWQQGCCRQSPERDNKRAA